MNEKKEVTIEQLLIITMNQLSEIPVPVKNTETIGIPIRQAISNIQVCLQAMKDGANRKKQEEEVPQILPVGEEEISENVDETGE